MTLLCAVMLLTMCNASAPMGDVPDVQTRFTQWAQIQNEKTVKILPGPTPEQLAAVERIHAAGQFAMGNMPCTVWETAWYARGMEVLMMDMMAEPELAEIVQEYGQQPEEQPEDKTRKQDE